MSDIRYSDFFNPTSSDQKNPISSAKPDQEKSRLKMLNKLLINVANNIIFIILMAVFCEKLVYSINHDIGDSIWL